MADAPVAVAPAPSQAPAPAAVAPVAAAPAAAPADAPAVDPAAAPAVAAKAPDAPATPDPKPADPAAIVPEKYDFKDAKLPETFALSSDLVDAVTPLLTKKGFTQAEANELVNTYAQAVVKAEAATEQKREADFKEWMAAQVTQHQAALRKEWGTGYDANMVVAQRGMARVFGPEGKAILDETGLGNHPEFVKAFHKVGQMVSEDIPPGNGLPPGTARSAAEILYGSKSN